MYQSLKTAKCVPLLPYSDAISSAHTFNKNQLSSYTQTIDGNNVVVSDYLWLLIPQDLAKYLTLVQVNELGVETIPYDISQISRETFHPWLKLPAATINLVPGFHMYEFIFDNKEMDVSQRFYFCYYMQVNNPDKPYVYMERNENS